MPLRLAAEKDVLADRQIVGEREVLVDRLDAVVARLLGRGEVDRLAAEQDVAFVVAEHAGNRLDDRRLAGAVVAGERDDLAGMDVERHAIQRLHGAEGLRDVADREDGLGVTQPVALPSGGAASDRRAPRR